MSREEMSGHWYGDGIRSQDDVIKRVDAAHAQDAFKSGQPVIVNVGGIGKWYREKEWNLKELRETLGGKVIHSLKF